MRHNPDNDVTWLDVATRRDVVSRSLRVALIVGTILVVINQGDALLMQRFPSDLFWKIPLTYLVPFSVSTYAAVDAIKDRKS